ncbi:MAG: transketolase [Nitrospirae bacterium]|nr:transketolase [Nitrospirota bacterium]
MRNAYIDALYELAGKDERVLALVADNGAIVYDKFRAAYPGRFINFGIAEANMIGVAAGLASCGKVPFTYTIASFLTMRAFEQIRNDVCMQRMNVKLVGIGAGFVYSNLGATHHATIDMSIMRALPGMTVFSPSGPLEARKITKEAARIDGPVYIRLSVGGSPEIYEADYEFETGKGVILRDGPETVDAAIFTTGGIITEVLKAHGELRHMGINARVVNVHTIKPIDKDIIIASAAKTRVVITVEEHSIIGGLGSAVAEVIAENGIAARFKRIGLQGVFAGGYGTYDDMKEMNGLSANAIVSETIDCVNMK